MSAPLRLLLAGGVLAAVGGCTLFIDQEALYLRSAQGQASQGDIRQRLGPPHLVASTPAGESVWVYDVYTIEPGGQNTWVTTGSWCDEYVLTFDGQGILSHWTHESELHGGELMPTSCVTEGVKPPS